MRMPLSVLPASLAILHVTGGMEYEGITYVMEEPWTLQNGVSDRGLDPGNDPFWTPRTPDLTPF